MGGDKVPTLLDPFVEWFEEWKAKRGHTRPLERTEE